MVFSHFLYFIYQISLTPDEFAIEEQVQQKAQRYRKQNDPTKFNWKLAQDDPTIPLKQREEKLSDAADRVRNSILKANTLLEERNFKPYEGMIEEFDDYYDRLKQLEQRFDELNLEFEAPYYGADYWALPLWRFKRFQKAYQMFLCNSGIRRAYHLRKMKKEVSYLGYDIGQAYDQCTKISYFSDVQVKDSEIALEALKEMNGILKKASKQSSNTATLKWACEMDEDIFTIQIHLEKRRAFVDSINRKGERI